MLVLRKTHADGASRLARFGAWAIKARLVSQYCHAGVSIQGVLYHATPDRGLHAVQAGDWQPDKWVAIEYRQSAGVAQLAVPKKIKYDWFSLLAFVGLRVRDSKRMYCFEWCWFCMTGEKPITRITPEMLIEKAYELKTKR
jgi:hypothetical protein